MSPRSPGFGSSVMKSKTIRKSKVMAGWAGAMLAPVLASLLTPAAVWAQYSGQVTKKTKDTLPDLRAIAVLEWTGDLGKPKSARIVPVTIFDGEKLQDAGIYLARPQPLALTGEVEYELKRDGKTFGFFDIQNAGQDQGTWVGFGKWKPLPPPKPVKATAPAKVDDYTNDEKPVLHRKKDSSSSGGSGSGSGPADPDRPTLHKGASDGDSGSPGSDTAAGPAPDPDRPKVEKKTSDAGSTPAPSGTSPSPDPNRPTLSRGNQAPQPDYLGNVDAVRGSGDPDRPTLKHGKSAGVTGELTPTLMGLPEDMQQAVAVSDAKNRPDHPWTFSWANPEDEDKMKSEMEDIAREAMGLSAPIPAPAHSSRTTTTGTVRKTAKPAASAPVPAPLEDERFHVFELAYGSGATMVLTANSGGPPDRQKFVTIVAQPDLYGKVRVLLKSVTDMAHMDETPRMRLVDAVDALADNRGELLFELRGDGTRQFALYRIYRGTAEKLFVSGIGAYRNIRSE
jgi:hypothetical protein